MRKIFDIHMHFPRNWEKPDEDPTPMVENLYEKAVAAGITKANFLCGGRFGISHEDSIKHAERHDDLFIPTALIDPAEAKENGKEGAAKKKAPAAKKAAAPAQPKSDAPAKAPAPKKAAS